MQNTFGSLVAVALVASGFLLTGDLGWCARRVSRAFDSTAAVGQEGSAAAPPAVDDAEAVPAAPAPPRATPVLRRAPTAGMERIDLTTTAPGQKIVVWTAGRGVAPDCHVIHVLDPSSGEALLQRRGVDGDGPARRVAISAAAPPAAFSTAADAGVLRLRGTFSVRPLGLAPGLDGIVESCGPIAALTVE